MEQPENQNQTAGNEESPEPGTWICFGCFRRTSCDPTPSASTTEDLTQSSTEPTDPTDISSLTDAEVGNLNPVQQAQPQVSNVASSIKVTCFKCGCLKSDQESTSANDEVTRSSTDPSDLSKSSTKEAIEMENIRRAQKESSGPQEGSLKETANQQDNPSKQEMTDGTDPSSSDYGLETQV